MSKLLKPKLFHFVIFLFFFTCVLANTSYSQGNKSINSSNKSSFSVTGGKNYNLSEKQNLGTAELLAKSGLSPVSYAIANQNPLVTDEWQFFVAPYLWFVGLNGDLAVNGQQSSVDASFGDIWDQLDFAFQIHAEAMKNNYFFYIDETYMKLSINQNIEPDLPLPIGANINIGVQMNLLDFGGGYRLIAPSQGVPVYFDLYGGGRWWIVDIDQNINFQNIPSQSSSTNEKWFDFIVGARMIALLGDNFIATVKTDFGGFDFSFSSKFTWNIIANLGYETNWHGFTPFIGWRSLYVDYEDGSGSDFFQYNVWMNGIQAGLGFRF
ncbi:MAG: hypothetical protein ACR2NW_09870 [Thermodesulfobacteriota bacterium]